MSRRLSATGSRRQSIRQLQMVSLREILTAYQTPTQVKPNPKQKKVRQMMQDLGILTRLYGTGRTSVLRVNPDIAEALGKELIESAKEARQGG